MTAIASGVFKKLTIKKQAALGTVAPGGAATGLALRRTTSTLDLTKASYKSTEILPSQQLRDGRHGVKGASGTLSGEFSTGTYQMFQESILRAAAAATVTTGAVVTVAAAVVSGAQGTFTRSAGSFITDGFRVGDVVTWAGWATTGVPNNAHNFAITSLSATVMTGFMINGVAVGPKAAGDSVTCTSAGKKITIPATGQTRDYYTVEHWFSDIAQDELFTDVVIDQMQIKMPATGMATIAFPVKGLNMTPGTAQYFTSPAGPSTGKIYAAVNGFLMLAGVNVGTVTAMDLTVNANMAVIGGVVGSNVDPDILPGVIDVSGTLSILFSDNVVRDHFINEDIFSIILVLSADNTAGSAFTAISLPVVKLMGATKDDSVKQITQSSPFTAFENTDAFTVAGQNQGTVAIMDSAFT